MEDYLRLVRNHKVIEQIYDDAFHDDRYEKDGAFIIMNGRKVVRPSKQDEIITQEYRNVRGGLGRDKFFAYLQEKYIGISKRETMEFLRSVEERQIHLKPVKGFVSRTRPILTNSPKKYLQIDLADFRTTSWHNGGYKFLLVVIDIFSKYVMVSKLKRKTPIEIREAIKRHLHREHFKPKIIQSDNGGEFQGEFSVWCKENFIQQRHSLSHTPQSQGIVERTIGTLKRRMRTKKWTEEIDDVVRIYNNSIHSTTKTKPLDLWGEITEEDTAIPRINLIKSAKGREDERRIKEASLGGVLKEGDYVRILTKEFSAIHRKDKIIQWSSDIFRVRKISYIRKYTLSTPIYYIEGMKKQFTRNKLQKVEPSLLRKIEIDVPNVEERESLAPRVRAHFSRYDADEYEL